MPNPPRPRGLGRGGWLARSFGLRLGVGFALVAVVGAAGTALVVNAVFAARFDRYLHQQQTAELGQLSTAIGRAYVGQGRWDPTALATVAPTVGAGTVRVVTPGGQDIWHWDGHRMGWDDQWMDHRSQHSDEQQSGRSTEGSSGDVDSGSHSDQPSGRSSLSTGDGWDPHPAQRDWQGLSSSQGRSVASVLIPAGRPAAVLAMAAPTTTPPTTSTTTLVRLGPVQRIPIQVDGRLVGTALVQLPQPTALPAAMAFRAQVIRLLLGGGAVGALGSLALGLILARRATRPVRQVTGAARALATGDRAVRLDASRADEFGELSRAFNNMADAVQSQEQLRKSFAAEVAHELRTPLTILRSEVEGLQVGVLAPTAEALGSLEEEVGRMTRLVADLQVLSAADAAGFSLDRAPTDLQALAKETAEQFAGLFAGAEILLETHLGPVTALVDRGRITQVLANLLSNALKFTPARGQVRLELWDDGDQAVLQVSDSGPGIAAEELPHVFDRFWRGSRGRASGTGIGLTVVRELVAAHDGTVQVASQPGQGASFTVRLPVQPTPPDNRFHIASSPPPSRVEV
jgi:two-component system sensor histidine kinase BaeS